MICEDCGKEHTRCKAHRRGSKKKTPCMSWPIKGLTVCKNHGGSSKRAREAAKNNLQEKRAAAIARTYGMPRDIDPHEALLEEVHRTAGHIAWLNDVIAGLDPDSLVWGVTQDVYRGSEEFPGQDIFKEAKPNVWVDLYQRERAHLVRVSKACLDAGVDERRVRIAEQQGAIVARAMTGLLDALYARMQELGMDGQQLDMVFYEEAPGIARAQLSSAAQLPEGDNDDDSAD